MKLTAKYSVNLPRVLKESMCHIRLLQTPIEFSVNQLEWPTTIQVPRINSSCLPGGQWRNFVVAKCVPRACAYSSSSPQPAFSHVLPWLKHRISHPITRRPPNSLRGHYNSRCACRLSPRHSRAGRTSI